MKIHLKTSKTSMSLIIKFKIKKKNFVVWIFQFQKNNLLVKLKLQSQKCIICFFIIIFYDNK